MKALAQFRRPLAMIERNARRTAIAVAALLALALLTAFAQHVYVAAKPAAYLTARVVRADLEDAVMTTGTLQAYRQVDVGTQVSGQLKWLKVRLGDHVAKGQRRSARRAARWTRRRPTSPTPASRRRSTAMSSPSSPRRARPSSPPSRRR